MAKSEEDNKKEQNTDQNANNERVREDKNQPGEGEENPIDDDKVTKNPGTLDHAHHAGSAVVKPTDKSKIRNQSVAAMEQQTEKQMDQIQEQIQVLANQAKDIQRRKEISLMVYEAKINFQPAIGHQYYLYLDKKDDYTLSMIGPEEWGRSCPFQEYIASVTLMADHTWQVDEGKDLGHEGEGDGKETYDL